MPKTPRIQEETLDGKVYKIAYKVTTKEGKSLGLRKNPNIMTFRLNEWSRLKKHQIEAGIGDWGGIWLARTLGAARRYKKYMMTQHSEEARVFKSIVDEVLFVNNERVKTNATKPYQEIFRTYHKPSILKMEERQTD